MDFIEKEALSVPEAVFSGALALGIDEKEAQVQVLSAPGSRRVKVRVGRPGVTMPPASVEAASASAPVAASAPAPRPSFATESAPRPAYQPSSSYAPSAPRASGDRMPPSEAQAEALRADFEKLLQLMGTPGKVELKQHAGNTVMNISGGSEGLLIGMRGATLDALQTIALQMLSTASGGRDLYVVVDVADYRFRAERKWMDMARELATKALAEGVEQSMGPLSPAERRVVHMEIKSIPGVESFSVGNGSSKKVIIQKKVE